MAIKKEFTSSNFTILKNGNKEDFPVKTKYAFNNDIWTVTEAFKNGPDQWRKVINSSRTVEESLSLATLVKDSQDPTFSIVEEEDVQKQI